MKRTSPMMPSAVFAATLLVAAPAMSVGNYAAMSPLPPEQRQGSVTYMSGGIGQDEAAAMRREESKFSLTLEFDKQTKPRDQYLSGVDVTIKDHSGNTVLDAIADGPLLLANLPDGKYTVIAYDNGQRKKRDVVIAGHQQERVVFEW